MAGYSRVLHRSRHRLHFRPAPRDPAAADIAPIGRNPVRRQREIHCAAHLGNGHHAPGGDETSADSIARWFGERRQGRARAAMGIRAGALRQAAALSRPHRQTMGAGAWSTENPGGTRVQDGVTLQGGALPSLGGSAQLLDSRDLRRPEGEIRHLGPRHGLGGGKSAIFFDTSMVPCQTLRPLEACVDASRVRNRPKIARQRRCFKFVRPYLP
jgi:hypothetical protein